MAALFLCGYRYSLPWLKSRQKEGGGGNPEKGGLGLLMLTRPHECNKLGSDDSSMCQFRLLDLQADWVETRCVTVL